MTVVTDDAVDQLDVASEEMARLIEGIRDDAWSASTPCADWNVRELVAHIVESAARFARILQPDEHPASSSTVSADAYRVASQALIAALRVPGVMEREYAVPVGTVPGAVVVHLRLTETLVHGWDLAQATGQTTRFDDGVAAQELEFTEGALAIVPPDRQPFAAPRSVPDSATALERLAGLLGRDVGV